MILENEVGSTAPHKPFLIAEMQPHDKTQHDYVMDVCEMQEKLRMK